MDIKKISDDYAVSPQIAVEDVAAIKQAGYKSIVCNRPDGEDAGQPTVETISKAAKEAGLSFRHVPVVSGAMTIDDVTDMATALRELPGPVFAYCRSGTRSANLYGIIQERGL
ncbi:TIGR01244 family sulfur transferase [Nitratireductor rhodophyticola]|uniref:TIGR01244 family phosphatase n=1 Tax=Nitratireductor rhodophyticola TaxID=2854036 RepID=A0ABS7R8Q2_9HYPH|nr:TIGR01244 family sulfur transferase [Nitratireductor rhodophyticola]MBY8916750.1 TIGR01244 family phosphatase [Nitratireductor rhodophyticola]MBY8920821.1 TIGR01244 family phosphatase [Nitratireductor rhodophyticola]WPZ14448.1 TIGR01244 family sulfur transferase [Nitratireductor rhodophyticola]